MLYFALLYSCGIAVCDTYVLPGNLYWLSNVCSICRNASFLMVLKRCSKPHCLSAHHFVCLYCVCRLSGDGDSPFVASAVVFFFTSLENCIGWLCFRCRCMFVVLPLLVGTVLQLMQHTGSSRLSGSPRSFGLNPKCSHTQYVYMHSLAGVQP